MSDAVLKIGAIVDTESITTGMAEGVAGVKAAAQSMTVSFQEVQSRSTAAWKRISEDTKEAAASVSAESRKVAESTRAAAAAQADLRNVLAFVRTGNVEAAAATALLAAAQDKQRGASTQLKHDLEGIAEAGHHVVPEMAASSAAIRSFEGAVPIRAIERFVGTTLGLGPLLKGAFPLIGAVDLGIMLFKTGDEMYELEKKGKKAGEEINRAFGEMADKLQTSNDELSLTNSKIEDQIAKLSGHPTNGLQTALEEALVSADHLQGALAADVKELQALLKEHDVSGFEGILSGVAATGGASEEINEQARTMEKKGQAAQAALNSELDAAKVAHEQAVTEAGKNRERLKAADEAFNTAKLAATNRSFEAQKSAANEFALWNRTKAAEIARQQRVADDNAIVMKRDHGMNITPIDLTPLRNSYEDAADLGAKIARRAEESKQNLADNQKLGDVKEHKGDGEAARKPAEERLRAAETELGELRQVHNVTLKEEHDFWAARVGEFARGTEQYKTIADKIGQIDQESARKASEAIKAYKSRETREGAAEPAEQESVERSLAGVNKVLKEQAEDITQTGERWAGYNSAVTKGKEIAVSLQETMELGQVRLLEQMHGITALGAAQWQAKIHADEHARALKALREELEALQAVGAGLKPGDKGYEQNLTQQQNVKNQITQQQGSGQVQQQADHTAIAEAIAKPYLTGFDQINTGWLRVQNGLIAGNRNISREFARMGLDLVQSAAKAAEQVLANDLRGVLQRAAVHRAAMAQQIATDASGAAAGAAIAKSSNAVQGLDAAKLAFKNTYATVSGWPIIGPVVAPVAAAGAFAAVAAFEQGTQFVPRVGMAVLHPGEAVLGSPSAQVMRDALQGRLTGSGGDADVHVHVGQNNFSGGGSDFRAQFDAHERHIVRTIKRLHREGKINLGR